MADLRTSSLGSGGASDDTSGHELYFMCDDLKAEVAALEKKGVHCSEVQNARWGSVTRIRLPGGGGAGSLPAQASVGVHTYRKLIDSPYG